MCSLHKHQCLLVAAFLYISSAHMKKFIQLDNNMIAMLFHPNNRWTTIPLSISFLPSIHRR
jgi:hypothetical protein